MTDVSIKRSGMTLIEVLMAVFILGVGVLGLMEGIRASLEVFRASSFVHQATNVFNAGEAEYPLVIESNPEEDLIVDPDTDLVEGWSYERTVEEEEEGDEDGLYVVRVKVMKGQGGPGLEQEYIRLIYHSN